MTYTGPDIVSIPDGTRCRVTLDAALVGVDSHVTHEGPLDTKFNGSVWVGTNPIASRVRGGLYPVSNLLSIEVLS